MLNSAEIKKKTENFEQHLHVAAKTGNLEAIKLCYKLHKHEFNAELYSSAASLAILNKHFQCVKYLIDLGWHTFSNKEKCLLLKIAALTASKYSEFPETIRENTKSLAFFIKKYKPTFPEGTFHQLKKDYCKAFENLQSPYAQKTNDSFLPMFKNASVKTAFKASPIPVAPRKPVVLVNLLEDDLNPSFFKKTR